MSILRIGKVTEINATEGRVKVTYEDTGSSSIQLAMLSYNDEYKMPSIGDRVVTLHMENGGSKGFVLGTYYGGGSQPKASSGYRKDLGDGAYIAAESGAVVISGDSISIQGDTITLGTTTLEKILQRISDLEERVTELEAAI